MTNRDRVVEVIRKSAVMVDGSEAIADALIEAGLIKDEQCGTEEELYDE